MDRAAHNFLSRHKLNRACSPNYPNGPLVLYRYHHHHNHQLPVHDGTALLIIIFFMANDAIDRTPQAVRSDGWFCDFDSDLNQNHHHKRADQHDWDDLRASFLLPS